MRKFILLCLFLSVISCSSKDKVAQPVVINTVKISELPEWVIDPKMDEKIAGVGIASASVGGFDFQLKKAELDARANIATQIQVEISRVTKNAIRQAKVGEVEDIEQVFTEATKEVVKKMPLAGVRRVNIYQGTDGTLYVRMAIDADKVIKYFENQERVYMRKLRQANLSRENLDKAQEAVKELFVELE